MSRLFPLGGGGWFVGEVEEDLGDVRVFFKDALGDFGKKFLGKIAARQHGLDCHESAGKHRPKHYRPLARFIKT